MVRENTLLERGNNQIRDAERVEQNKAVFSWSA